MRNIPDSTVHIRMWMDPHPNGRVLPRISAQIEPLNEHAFPAADRKPRGFPIRELDVPAAAWNKLLQGGYTPETQQKLHAQWWDEAAGEHDLPGSFELVHDYQLALSGETTQPAWAETAKRGAFKKMGARWQR